MHLHHPDGPTHYLYCLVDTANKRFKFGSTPHRRYPLTLLLANQYCPNQSVQIGYVAELAALAETTLRAQYADMVVDVDGAAEEEGVWLDIKCLHRMRFVLTCVPAREEMIEVTMIDPEMVKTLACEAIEQILGMNHED